MLARTSNFAQQFVLQRVLICYNKKHDAITISLLNEYFFFFFKQMWQIYLSSNRGFLADLCPNGALMPAHLAAQVFCQESTDLA